MSEIECYTEQAEIENDDGFNVPGVITKCGDCGHETESFGTGDPSIKRNLALMREECPVGNNNFYVDA